MRWVLVLSLTLVAGSNTNALAQFIETFEHVGTMRMLKGQVRDSLDLPVAHARLRVSALSSETTYSIEADEDGVFGKKDLPAGKYSVRVSAMGFNFGEYTVLIKPHDSSASNKYTVVRLSPGCASGNSGVALVSKLSQRSYRE